jgi:hypothetical protein
MQTPTRSAAQNPNPAPSTRGTGRPSTFTPAILEALTTLIAQLGLSDSGAAKACGLSTSTLSRWKHEYPDLALALFQARCHFQRTQLDIILAAAQNPRTGWRAAAWLLERIFPEEYCPRAAEREKFRRLAAENEAELDASLEAAPSNAHPHPLPQTPVETTPSAPLPKIPETPASTPLSSRPILPITAKINRIHPEAAALPKILTGSISALPANLPVTVSQNSQNSPHPFLAPPLHAAA